MLTQVLTMVAMHIEAALFVEKRVMFARCQRCLFSRRAQISCLLCTFIAYRRNQIDSFDCTWGQVTSLH